jgi:hypothetical protein
MADTREVKITAKDIESVNGKLRKFAKQLPEGEQNVMAWLLGRAADAPQDKPDFLPEAKPSRGGRATAVKGPLNEALGVAQFEKLKPGSSVAGSSVGVTGTIMF